MTQFYTPFQLDTLLFYFRLHFYIQVAFHRMFRTNINFWSLKVFVLYLLCVLLFLFFSVQHSFIFEHYNHFSHTFIKICMASSLFNGVCISIMQSMISMNIYHLIFHCRETSILRYIDYRETYLCS